MLYSRKQSKVETGCKLHDFICVLSSYVYVTTLFFSFIHVYTLKNCQVLTAVSRETAMLAPLLTRACNTVY